MTKKFNDDVEAIFRELYEDESFRKYLVAVYNSQAVEGSIVADQCKAAQMIHDRASMSGYVGVANAKLFDISKALNVVLRRFGTSRKERRDRAQS